jgi:large subunit ribosomal protein L9
MQVILLERVERLGQMGDEVKVRPGFARNFLLPKGKALRANAANRARFERERGQLEARNLERRQEAEAVGEKLRGQVFVAIRQAGETGQLYGSVTARDIAEAVTSGGFSVERSQVVLDRPIKSLGLHEVRVALHPEVIVAVTVNVARTEDEAARQARGEDVTVELDEDVFEEPAVEAEAVFEDPDAAAAALEQIAEAVAQEAAGVARGHGAEAHEEAGRKEDKDASAS